MAAFFKGGKVLRVVSGVVRNTNQFNNQQQQQQHGQQQNGGHFMGANGGAQHQIWNWEMLQTALPTSNFAAAQFQVRFAF